MIIEKQQFCLVATRSCITNKNVCRPEINNEIEIREIGSAVLRMGLWGWSVVW